MRERDVHDLIEQLNPEEKKLAWERIREQLNLPQSQPKQAPAKKKRLTWALVAMAVVCVVTLAIVLPITLRGDDSNVNRYCDSTQYTVEGLNQTIQEYCIEHNINLLYVDWYDVAEDEDISTDYGYINGNPNDVVFFEEVIFNSDTEEELTLSITDNKTRVDKFEWFNSKCEDITVKTVNVSWKNVNQKLFASFEYESHVYYLQLETDGGQERLVEIIEGMLK